MPVSDPEKRREYERKRNQDPLRKQANRDRINAWKKANPEKMKETRRVALLKHRYGLTPDQYREMYDAQQGICANPACRRPAEYIDHCHATGEVRALLCRQCNFALGMIHDTPALAYGLIEYLKRFTNAK